MGGSSEVKSIIFVVIRLDKMGGGQKWKRSYKFPRVSS